MQRRNPDDVETSGRATSQWPLPERRRQERRLPGHSSVWNVLVDMDDRRLGLGRRWDDWCKRRDAA